MNDRVIIENGGLRHCLEDLCRRRKTLVVTDEGVPSFLTESCKYLLRLPQGESSKSYDTVRLIHKTLLDNGFGRADCIAAVGGGMVGDVTGFAASCYMRGMGFHNFPTTLLSQIDSSNGGKTAINFEGVKNLIGSFYAPERIFIDPSVLGTLDRRQFNSGLAEAIKMAATHSYPLFQRIAHSPDVRLDIEEIIRECVSIKTSVVESDPFDKGLRRVLNFGHTVGHAIEAVSEGVLLHGECVGMGMLYFCSPSVREELIEVLCKYSLPTSCDYPVSKLMEFVIHDKKSNTAVFVDKIGSFRFIKYSKDSIKQVLEYGKFIG